MRWWRFLARSERHAVSVQPASPWISTASEWIGTSQIVYRQNKQWVEPFCQILTWNLDLKAARARSSAADSCPCLRSTPILTAALITCFTSFSASRFSTRSRRTVRNCGWRGQGHLILRFNGCKGQAPYISWSSDADIALSIVQRTRNRASGLLPLIATMCNQV